MSPQGRPKGEYRSAQHEGAAMSPQGRPKTHLGARGTPGRPVNMLRIPAGGLRSSTFVEPEPETLAGARVMLDASALLKRYASEVGHLRVLDVFAQADRLFVAAHCQSEVAAALLLRRREGILPASEFERIWVAVRRDVADMECIALDDHVERYAFAAMELEPMRVTDALYLGSALVANIDLFVTANWRLRQVAHAMGLQAECLGITAEVMGETAREEVAQA